MSFIDCCDWDKCTLCGECLERCPVIGMGKYEARSTMKLLLEGKPAPRLFGECTLCFACNNFCPEGLRPYELILERITGDRSRVPAMVPYFFNGRSTPNIFQDLYNRLSLGEREILRRWSEPPPASRDVLYIGCIGKLLCGDIDNSHVLRSLPKFGPSDICCGEIAYRGGIWDAYVDTVERTLARFGELDAERVVCYCASCFNFLSNILPRVYGKEFPFELISLYGWLLEKLDAGELEVKRPLDMKAAIHESCYVSELGAGFSEDLRRLYEAAGVRLVEMKHNSEYSLSCGAASIARSWSVPGVIREQHKRYLEARAAGSARLALNCPGCYLTMLGTAWTHGVKLHYMPDELLRAFGDDISVPLGKRFRLFAETLAKRMPLAIKRASLPLPRVQP